MKLIDKDALVAEINKRIKDAPIDCYGHQRVWAYNDVKDILDTLEVKLPIKDIWHKIGEDDLPQVGDIICCTRRGKVKSGEYRANKFYGKVCDGYDTPLEKDDKWCLLADIIESVELKEAELRAVNLEKKINRWQGCEAFPEGVGITPLPKVMKIVERTAKHFFELGLRSTITEEDCKLIWDIGDEIPQNMSEEEFFKELLKRYKAQKGK